MKVSHWRIVKFTTACLVTLAMLQAAYAGHGNGKGKPGGGEPGGGEPPTLPNVRYEVVWLGSLGAACVNTAGNVVGGMANRACLYTEVSNVVVDLNNLVGAVWNDLSLGDADAATGWIAESANEINESNQIVGRARHSETLETRAFILIDTFSVAPQFLLLPKVGTEGVNSGVYSARLNDLGDVIALQPDVDFGYSASLYSRGATPTSYTAEDLRLPVGDPQGGINNDRVIVTWEGWRYTPGYGDEEDLYEYFPDHHFWAVNNADDGLDKITGGFRIVRKPGKNGYDAATIRVPVTAVFGDPVEVLHDVQGGRDINDSHDVCLEADRFLLFMDGYGLMAIDDLIAEGSQQGWADTAGTRRPRSISNRTTTGFGYICGGIGSSFQGFLLRPVPYVAP